MKSDYNDYKEVERKERIEWVEIGRGQGMGKKEVKHSE